MKKMLYTAALWLLAATLTFAQNNLLKITATGTGNTTGHIANLSVFNPTTSPLTFTLSPCYIPSDGGYQPYILPTMTTAIVQSGSTANIPVNGYCADIHRPPVPSGASFPPPSSWVAGDQNLKAATLLDAFQHISTVFDSLKNSGAITTPFSGNPEKEREAVIQQTFWIHAAELEGKKYVKEDFKTNTIKQFESTTGLVFEKTKEETKQSVTAGIDQFWSTFEAVGAEAKVLASKSGHPRETIPIGNPQDKKGDKCTCEDITVDVMIGNDKITATGKFGKGEPAVIEQKKVADNKIGANVILSVSIAKLTVKCACDAGNCTPCSANTTSAKDLEKVKTNEAYAEAEAAAQVLKVAKENLSKDPKNKDKKKAVDDAQADYDAKLKKAEALKKQNGIVGGDYISIKHPTVKGEKINGGEAKGAWNDKGVFEHLEGKPPVGTKGFPLVNKNKEETLTYEFTVEASCVNGECATAKCVKSFKLILVNKK